jgi:hypothetical protein
VAERTSQQILDLIGHRRDWTPVAVRFDNRQRSYDRVFELAEQRRWQVISLDGFEGFVPDTLEVRGVLTDLLPSGEAVVNMRLLDLDARGHAKALQDAWKGMRRLTVFRFWGSARREGVCAHGVLQSADSAAIDGDHHAR